jgi:predicted aconitase with swiveling domain
MMGDIEVMGEGGLEFLRRTAVSGARCAVNTTTNARCFDFAPKAIVFGKTNPVMVQGAVFAGITITEGWSEDPSEDFRTGDTVRVDPQRKRIDVLKRA